MNKPVSGSTSGSPGHRISLPLELQSVRRISMCLDNSATAAEAPVEFLIDMKPKSGMMCDDA